MHKLIILLALVACALASWSPSIEHEKHPHQGSQPHQAIGHGKHASAVVGHARHVGRAGHGHGRGLGASHGQSESVHHGASGSSHNKEFHRMKKSHDKKSHGGNKSKNHLRRAQSANKNRHH